MRNVFLAALMAAAVIGGNTESKWTVTKGSTSAANQAQSMRLSHGMFTTWTLVPRVSSASAAFSASCSMTGPYAKRSASEPSRRTAPRPCVTSESGSSRRRGDGPIASLMATLSSASSTAHRTTALVSSALDGWTTIMFGNAESMARWA